MCYKYSMHIYFIFSSSTSFLGVGIMSAGGQNIQLSPFTNMGYLSIKKLAGLLIFSHYWFWYPFTQYLSLAFDTTELILINDKFDVIDETIESSLSPESQDYYDNFKPSSFNDIGRVHSAVLSFVKNRYKNSGSLKNSKITFDFSGKDSSSQSKDANANTTKSGALQSKKHKSSSKKSKSKPSQRVSFSVNVEIAAPTEETGTFLFELELFKALLKLTFVFNNFPCVYGQSHVTLTRKY